jgi:hypothetical protein
VWLGFFVNSSSKIAAIKYWLLYRLREKGAKEEEDTKDREKENEGRKGIG